MSISLLAGILSLFAYALYIYKIWWGDTRPSRSSWWLLSVVWVVLLLSSISLVNGGTFVEKFISLPGGWLTLSYIVGSLVIAVSTIWRGSSDPWGSFDYTCAGVTAVALVFYLFVGIPIVSLILAIIADLFAILPTVKNAWKFPIHEDFIAWTITLIASILSITAVESWKLTQASFAEWSTPLYLVLINGLITFIIARRFVKKRRTIIHT